MIQENANKDCDFFIAIWYPSVSHGFVEVISLSLCADCISTFQILVAPNDMIFSNFVSSVRSSCCCCSTLLGKVCTLVIRSLLGLVADNEIVRTKTESKDFSQLHRDSVLTQCSLFAA